MPRRWMKLGVMLLCLAATACGPLLDVNDAFSGRVGPHTAFGSYHRDFWGNRYFVPINRTSTDRAPPRPSPPENEQTPRTPE